MITAVYHYNILDRYASLVHIKIDGKHIGTLWGRVHLSRRNGDLMVRTFDESEIVQSSTFFVDRFLSERKYHESIN